MDVMQFHCDICGKLRGPSDYPYCRQCGNEFRDPCICKSHFRKTIMRWILKHM